MSKTFVLDTNVLLQSPNAIFAFDDNIVILTEAVLEEIDSFKKGHSDLNVNAREVSRILDKLREKGKLTDGVPLDNGGLLRIETNHRDTKLPDSWEQHKADNRILQVCKALKDQNEEVYLISKDINVRIKADIIDVPAQDFRTDQSPRIDEQYTGRKTLYVEETIINEFYKSGSLSIKDTELNEYNTNNNEYTKLDYELYPNEFIILTSADNPKKTALAKVSRNGREIVKLVHDSEHPYGITTRNVGQIFMQEALMSSVEDIPLVIIKGKAGTAKTFMALACGLENVVENHNYRKILVCRPNQMLDEDIGFLPGDEKDKIAPLMRPIMDNLEVLVDSDKNERYRNEGELQGKIRYLFESGYIDTQAVGFLRGRSISKQWILIDEAQNTSIKQIKAILTRCAEGSRIVLCGDPDQVDHPYLDARTNGLSFAAECMKGSKLCAIITAEDSECVRSPLAMESANRLSTD